MLTENNFLAQLDPRLKLPLLLGLIILVFAATNWIALGLVVSCCLALLRLGGISAHDAWRTLWGLRWLLLFTLLMHLLLTPGHMLFGSRWLSRDGLSNGLFVVAQLSFAVLGALLISRTTPVERMAAAFGWFLSPLRWLGCPVEAWQQHLLLVLKFLPLVRMEYLNGSSINNSEAATANHNWFQNWSDRVTNMLDRLLTHADQLAYRVVVGEERLESVQVWPPLRLFAGVNGQILVGAVLLLVLYLLVSGC